MKVWHIHVSKKVTRSDTLWRTSDGDYAITDGVNPNQADEGPEYYTIDLGRLVTEGVLIGNSFDGSPSLMVPRVKGDHISVCSGWLRHLEKSLVMDGVVRELKFNL